MESTHHLIFSTIIDIIKVLYAQYIVFDYLTSSIYSVKIIL